MDDIHRRRRHLMVRMHDDVEDVQHHWRRHPQSDILNHSDENIGIVYQHFVGSTAIVYPHHAVLLLSLLVIEMNFDLYYPVLHAVNHDLWKKFLGHPSVVGTRTYRGRAVNCL